LFIRQIRSRENRLARPREEARGAATAHDLHRGAAQTAVQQQMRQASLGT
jgi:hypothetical protein